MLDIKQTGHELKITWSFDENISEDLTEFLKIDALEKENSIESCSFYILGEKEISLVVWRALLSSLKVLLDRKVKFHFICTSKKMETWLNSFGFSLLGEVRLNPSGIV